MTVSSTSDHKEKHTREKKTARRRFSGTLGAGRIWSAPVVESVVSFTLSNGFKSCKHTDQVQHDVLQENSGNKKKRGIVENSGITFQKVRNLLLRVTWAVRSTKRNKGLIPTP